jgi:Ca-activated chloride channel family protein
MESGPEDLAALTGLFDRRAAGADATGSAVQIEQWLERGVYLLPLLLVLGPFAFRRGWLGIGFLLVLGQAPKSAEALSWRDLWLTPDQQAQQDFRADKPGQAAERFRDPQWKAAAEYKAGRFDQAAKGLEPLNTPASQYNRGNALAKQGQLEEALKAYDRSLALDPNDEDAAYNRKLVEEALKKRQEDEKKQDQKDRSEGRDQGQQSQEQQSGKKDEKREQEQGDNKNTQRPDQQQSQQSEPRNPSGESQQEQQGETPQGSEQDRPAENRSAQPGEQDQPKPEAPNRQPESARSGQEAEQDRERDEKSAQAESMERNSEIKQAEEQWLRRIPDDPGGLLKRKFYYQYRQRQQRQDQGQLP